VQVIDGQDHRLAARLEIRQATDRPSPPTMAQNPQDNPDKSIKQYPEHHASYLF
jgi:hypothetical protein